MKASGEAETLLELCDFSIKTHGSATFGSLLGQWIKKRAASLRWNLLRSVSSGSTDRGDQDHMSSLQLNWIMVKVSHVVLG